MTSIRRAELMMERAGYLQPTKLVGRAIESGLISGLLAVPKWAKIERGKIHWKDLGFGSVEPPSDLLDRFIELWQGDDDAAILNFAKSYGTLRRPLWLSQKRYKTDFEAWELLSRWRGLSHHAWELIQIAAALRARDRLTFEKWSELMSEERSLSSMGRALALRTREHYDTVKAIARELSRKIIAGSKVIEKMEARGVDMRGLLDENEHESLASRAKQYLDVELAAWNTKLGPVSFGVESDDDAHTGWKTVLVFGGSMICYVGFQLMLVVTGGDAFTCSACQRPYIRSREKEGFKKVPKPGEQNYCGAERCIRERNRIAAERYREKKTKSNRRRRDKSK